MALPSIKVFDQHRDGTLAGGERWDCDLHEHDADWSGDGRIRHECDVHGQRTSVQRNESADWHGHVLGRRDQPRTWHAQRFRFNHVFHLHAFNRDTLDHRAIRRRYEFRGIHFHRRFDRHYGGYGKLYTVRLAIERDGNRSATGYGGCHGYTHERIQPASAALLLERAGGN